MEKPVSPPSLEDLRHEIDAADRALLDQLERRFSAVERVKQVKGESTHKVQQPMRPAREAQILRQLLAQRQGPVPASLLVRLWRSIISSATSLQAKVAVHIGKEIEENHLLRDLVRDHFPGLPLRVGADDAEVVSRLAGSPFDIGAVRTQGDWVAPLLKIRGHNVRVMGVLPLLAPQNRPPRLIILGRAVAEPSGEDQTLIGFANQGGGACKDAIWELSAGAYRCAALAGFLDETSAAPAALKAVVLGRCPLSLGGGE